MNKKILLIGLGGTIACSATAEGLSPKYPPAYLLTKTPALKNMANVDSIELMKRTVVYADDWVVLAHFIADSYKKYDAFVIAMGTDTLAYTASMLSFMLGGLRKPVIITGAMLPMDQAGTDAVRNLGDSVCFAGGGHAGVYVVFDGKVIRGCRASKVSSNSPSAFESINAPIYTEIRDGEILCETRPQKKTADLELDTKINTNIIAIRLDPQTTSSLFDMLSDYDGYIVEGYGDGNVSDNLISSITTLIDLKKTVVVASQCIYGAVEHKYRGGRLCIEHGAVSAKDMSKEAVLTKLMWCLGKTVDAGEVRDLMYRDICGEIDGGRGARI